MADNLDVEETDDLIASDKVEGTAVFDGQGGKLGTINNFMVNKRSGQVEYAVLVSGGLFGVGGDYRPVPWNQLSYDTGIGGYVIGLDRDRLGQAPSYGAGDEPAYDRDYSRRINDYYGQI